MSKKIKRKIDAPLFHQGIHINHDETYCAQWKEDILLEFGHITSTNSHSIFDLLAKKDNYGKLACIEYIKLIDEISKSTWSELGHRSKGTFGGFETLSLELFKTNIWRQFDPNMGKGTKLYVFRFGNGKYRMVGYKSHKCSRVMHILGFDLDHSLYDHGN